MSSYSRLIFIVAIFVTFLDAKLDINKNKNDALMLRALDYELHKNINKSAKIYIKLYLDTKSYEYLNKAIAQSMIVQDYQTVYDLVKPNLDKYPKSNQKFYRLIIVASLQLGKSDEALILAKRLLDKYNNTTNYEVIGNVYYARAEYKKAMQYFESAYATNAKPNTLVSLVGILYSYMDKKKEAISYLQSFIRINGCEKRVCNKLVTFYREEQNIDGMISILKMQFKAAKTRIEFSRILNLLVYNLEKKDINLAIAFLEENRYDDTKLLLLYERAGEYAKALTLVRKKYRKTKNRALLGQIAILEFELANDKKEIMKHVIANFELALKVTNNVGYKNYYGYLLIDYKINIKKGLQLVKEALKSSPNNLAYMDSVAWGYYRLNSCTDAKSYIQKVVDQVGLENKEINLHWEKIQKCQE